MKWRAMKGIPETGLLPFIDGPVMLVGKKSNYKAIQEVASQLNAHDDLVEACRIALARLEQFDAEHDADVLGPCPACTAIRAALAKATAKEPTR